MTKPKKPAKPRLPIDQKLLIRQAAERELERCREKMANQLIDVSLAATAIAFMDVCGLKSEELATALDKWHMQFDCLVAETVDIESLYEIIETEGGVKLVRASR